MNYTNGINVARSRFDTLVIPDLDRLVAEIESRCPLRGSYDHGPRHWRCVAFTGLELLREVPEADPVIVFLFALFHDSQREDEYEDPEHGPRGGRLAAALHGDLFRVSPEQLKALQDACSGHNGAPPTTDPTLGVCWDADRLNLYRVGITPQARFLSTEAAKSRIQWAEHVYRQEFDWHDLYARFRALDDPGAEEAPDQTTGPSNGPVVRSVQSGAAKGRNRETLDRLFESGKIALRRSTPFDAAAGPVPSSFGWERIEGMMLGLAIGDALGNTSEGMIPHVRRSFHGEIRDYLSNRYAEGRPVGLPSDDTQMAFWTLDQINRDGGLEPGNLAGRFASERIFGRGSAVGEFVRNMHAGFSWEECAPQSAGNGGLMRIAPVLIPHISTGTPELWVDAALCARITHDDTANLSACVAFVAMLWDLLRMERAPEPEWWLDRYVSVARDLEDGTEYAPRGGAFLDWRGPLSRFVDEKVGAAYREGISVLEAGNLWYSGAYLLETVPSVLYILMHHGHDPEEAIVRAVNDTKDNDTIAAIVGAAVGALHGKEALPIRWRDNLLGRTDTGDDGRAFRILEEASRLWWRG